MNISLKECPLCSHSFFEHFLSVKDHMVSLDNFSLVKCNQCSFIFTNPRPTLRDMDRFYVSEDYISHKDKTKSFFDRIYFLARNYMFKQKHSWINSISNKREPLLDFGCGTGSFQKYMLKKGWDSWGVEPNHSARTVALNQSPGRVFEHLVDLPAKTFGTITLWHVLEHLPDLAQSFSLILSKLAVSGHLFVAVPNCNSYDAKFYSAEWAGYDVPRHLSHFTPETMQYLAEKHRLQLTKLIPLKLDAYYISLLSEKRRNGSFFGAFIRGFRSNQFARKNQLNYSSLVYVLRK